MVIRVGSSLGKRRTDEESKEGRRPEELIRRCQGLSRRLALAAPKSSQACNRVRVKRTLTPALTRDNIGTILRGFS